MMKCPTCLTGYSPDCPTCRSRSVRMPALKIWGTFPWGNHYPVWDDPTCQGMHCDYCGLRITPEMTMRELTGPCSGNAGSIRHEGEVNA